MVYEHLDTMFLNARPDFLPKLVKFEIEVVIVSKDVALITSPGYSYPEFEDK